MSTFVYGKNLMVLRRKKDKVALNVSYTEVGLKFTCNKNGKLLYFKKAFMKNGKFEGDLVKSDDVYVERFFPSTPVGSSRNYTIAECTWLVKALHL